MNPRELVREWVRLFNEGNADGLAKLYADSYV